MTILLCDVFSSFVKKIICYSASLLHVRKECIFPVMHVHVDKGAPCHIVQHVRVEM